MAGPKIALAANNPVMDKMTKRIFRHLNTADLHGTELRSFHP